MDFKRVNDLFITEGFLESSFTSLSSPLSAEIYSSQINTHNIGNMYFLNSHKEQKLNENQNFKTAFVGLYPYFPVKNALQSDLRVALYAQDLDYHKVLQEKLERIIESLQKLYPKEKFTYATDSKPILERDLAYRAGLGWIGKNTCLLNKQHGSLFFLAEVLTTLPYNQKDYSFKSDHCGTCTKCIDACPTEALTPRKMIVEKCISYQNIESKEYSFDQLNFKQENWFFGCDICQTVCPWNEKVHGKEHMVNLTQKQPLSDKALKELESILLSSNKYLEKKYHDFPLSRARGKGLKRNALLIIADNKLTEFIPFLKQLQLKNELENLKQDVLLYLKKFL